MAPFGAAGFPRDLFPPPTPQVKKLGIWTDNNLFFVYQTQELWTSCLFVLCMLMKIHPFLPPEWHAQSVGALLLFQLDVFNAIYLDLLTSLSSNSRAFKTQRFDWGLRKFDHVSKAHHALYWIPVLALLHFKVLCLIHKVRPSGTKLISNLVAYLPTRSLSSSSAITLKVPH